MCFFPLPNLNYFGAAYKKGIKEFSCGACPECLSSRASFACLTSVYEARAHVHNCMITLTYDTFVRDSSGKIVYDRFGLPLENPVNPDLKVNVRDVQLFLKRLRKWYSSVSDEKIKYRVAAEYGSVTHRAHYHVILFGVRFPDLVFYKKSKRGNPIYMSDILNKLWKNGICTVDCINVNSAVSRYCTKYLAKSRSDKTFSLCSHHLGLSELIKDFNGKSYIIDGREYPIPRSVWEVVICNRYSDFSLSNKYVNSVFDENDICLNSDEVERSELSRSVYRAVRDSDFQYSSYLSYWSKKADFFEKNKLPVRTRILQLSDSKYLSYKLAALDVYDRYRSKFIPFPAPGSNCVSSYYRYRYGLTSRIYGSRIFSKKIICPFPPCLNRANDTKNIVLERIFEKGPFFNKYIQISIDF